MNHYAPETREKVEADINAEITKARSDCDSILRSIFESLHNADLNETGRLQTTISRFAVLLCSMSRQADRIQRWMVALTVAMAFMTGAILWLTYVMASK